jgi:hypothetical protein
MAAAATAGSRRGTGPEDVMTSTRVDIGSAEWSPGSPLYGAAAVYEGRELVEVKVLSDRRAEGGGIAFLVKFMPPAGKLIKIVAVARSD